ncbi:DNA-binding protein [Actinoplanes sp. NPDC051861]|uniref:helix-turn-helix transcriptional regulator n=1 Tax=Actinoplanes sp. NPDC051861 TaxID=3155170 RepID=UPI0034138409
MLTVITVGERKRRLYTTGDIADMLGVTRQYALAITNDRRKFFPEPFDVLPGGVQVWLVEDVDAWMTAHPEHRHLLAEDPET